MIFFQVVFINIQSSSSSLLSNELNVQVCDAIGPDSSTVAGITKHFFTLYCFINKGCQFYLIPTRVLRQVFVFFNLRYRYWITVHFFGVHHIQHRYIIEVTKRVVGIFHNPDTFKRLTV